jgi:hypothetical protein
MTKRLEIGSVKRRATSIDLGYVVDNGCRDEHAYRLAVDTQRMFGQVCRASLTPCTTVVKPMRCALGRISHPLAEHSTTVAFAVVAAPAFGAVYCLGAALLSARLLGGEWHYIGLLRW